MLEVEFADPLEVDFDEPPAAAPNGFKLRDYQVAAQQAVLTGWDTYSRQLLDMATGTGKTSILNNCAAELWRTRRWKSLILENRDALVRQTAKRVAHETGLEVEIEMAGEHASPHAPIVVASVQSLARVARLMGFADDHFGLVIADECHHSTAATWSRILHYFHYGTESLTPGWKPPADGTYEPKARILGVTATPELTGTRHLGEIYQRVAYTYQLWQAINDGWLVPPIAKMEPLPVNFKGLRATRTSHGSDYNPTEVAERLIPVIEALAEQIVRLASDRKTMAFMPSKRTAEMLAEALQRHGLAAVFVSGTCLDLDAKTERFVKHGPGIVLTTAAMYTEGFDVPDVDCIFAGITKSKSYHRQKIGRATRILKGVVEHLPTAEERRNAIAASAKPNFLIIDPFCRCDDIDLCDYYDLFTDRPEVKKQLKASGKPTKEAAEEAERDFIKSLEREAKRAAKKAAKTVDPIAWGLMIGDTAIASYTPSTGEGPPTPGQIDFMVKNKIDHSKIKHFGLADKIIKRFLSRQTAKLATPGQLDFLHKLGIPEEKAALYTMGQAGAVIQAKREKWGR